MGTEVLHPQNFWVERHPTSFQRRRNFQAAAGNLPNLIVNRKVNNNNNSAHNKKTSPKHDRRKSPEPKNSRSAAVVGQVTILKRGESLDSLTSKAKGGNPNPKSVKSPNRKPVDDFAITGTGRIGSDSPNMPLKQIRLNGNRPTPPIDIYAGSACALSPSPRAVPLPSFFNKKNENEDLASKDLRRLLRLE